MLKTERRQNEEQVNIGSAGGLSGGEDSGSNAHVKRLTRERDDLQNMLDRFENHMIEIQTNVKVLTMERDKFRILYEQAQNELTLAKRDRSPLRTSASSASELRHLEEERDLVKSDFRRLQDENEELRDKMKVQQEFSASERFKLTQKIADLESTAQILETERFELKSTISELKEKISSLDNVHRSQSITLAQTQDDSSQYKAELNSLRHLIQIVLQYFNVKFKLLTKHMPTNWQKAIQLVKKQ
ncbi:unnamed protein product [Ranitomeya imitator]|uniref:Uncharacterized protein n=1 Tax=Ranitomeya imitator TaxID=111125 RepID=A0ABN9LIK5_9NEOB|nr:unnamed protein product [Ranitomeya imitator]